LIISRGLLFVPPISLSPLNYFLMAKN